MPIKNIQKILKEGSFKQKVKLYFTDIALFNLSYSTENSILTDQERDLIVKSIKTTRESEIYRDMRTANKGFLMYKPHVAEYKNYFEKCTALISNSIAVMLISSLVQDTVNDILDDISNKKDREKALKTALEGLEGLRATRYQEEEMEAYIELPDFPPIIGSSLNFGEVLPDIVKKLNEEAQYFKEILDSLKVFLDRFLPIEPYLDYVKREEKEIIEAIRKANELLRFYNVTHPEEPLSITLWEDIKIEVKDEYVQTIKESGL